MDDVSGAQEWSRFEFITVVGRLFYALSLYFPSGSFNHTVSMIFTSLQSRNRGNVIAASGNDSKSIGSAIPRSGHARFAAILIFARQMTVDS